MPIVLKEFEFTENDTTIYLDVPVKGVVSTKCDIYCNELYLKINSPPFFFELDLQFPIDLEESKAVIGKNIVQFTLKKMEIENWISDSKMNSIPKLQNLPDTDDEEDLNDSEIPVKDVDQEYPMVNSETSKSSSFSENDLNESKHEKSTLTTANPSSYNNESPKNLVEKADISQSKHASPCALSETKTEQQEQKTDFIQDMELDLEDDCEDGIDMEEIMAKVKRQLAKKDPKIPPPRASAQITVQFTDRGPLPTQVARESEDAKWMARIQEMKEQHKQKLLRENQASDLSENTKDHIQENHKNEQYWKEKGDTFYRQNNWSSAINAYTHALSKNPLSIPCLSNRSATFMHLEQYLECIQDCEMAITWIEKEFNIKLEEDPTLQMKPNEKKTLAKLYCRKAMALMLSGQQSLKPSHTSRNDKQDGPHLTDHQGNAKITPFVMETLRNDLAKAFALDPENPVIRQQFQQLSRAA